MSIGGNLREERERLGFNQTDFAVIGGVGRKSQFNYEEGERQPDAAYLKAIASVGADVQYILTGQRQGQGIGESAVHQAVLDAVDLLSLEKKVDANQLAKAVVKLAAKSVMPAVSTAPANSKIVVHGNVGQNFDAPISGGKFNIDMRNMDKKK